MDDLETKHLQEKNIRLPEKAGCAKRPFDKVNEQND